MYLKKLDVISWICKPIAIYIVALELNASFLMLLIAWLLFTVSLTVTFK